MTISKLVSAPPPDVTPILAQGLGEIAQGFQPTETLKEVGPALLSSWLQPSSVVTTKVPGAPLAAPADARGHPTALAQHLGPGGGWGGSYAPATDLARIGEHMGLKVTSTKRDTKMSASGLVSDHWVGSKNSYAYDLGGTTAEMDRAAAAIARRLGVNYNGKTELVLTKTIGGLRYQVLYQTHVGGNHFNHVHVGVRRVGG